MTAFYCAIRYTGSQWHGGWTVCQLVLGQLCCASTAGQQLQSRVESANVLMSQFCAHPLEIKSFQTWHYVWAWDFKLKNLICPVHIFSAGVAFIYWMITSAGAMAYKLKCQVFNEKIFSCTCILSETIPMVKFMTLLVWGVDDDQIRLFKIRLPIDS